ncbi:MAG: aldehyde dehydrogenase family protein, partial [Sphingomonadales bacterium]|nr:aldehyde dehydrogenase family protein [Sphingomonadales bacterium]
MSETLRSTCPATGELLWEGPVDDAAAVARALADARHAFEDWSETDLDARIAIVRAYADRLKATAEELAVTIARETGKPLWEGQQEVASMIGKVEISIAAQAERAGHRANAPPSGHA